MSGLKNEFVVVVAHVWYRKNNVPNRQRKKNWRIVSWKMPFQFDIFLITNTNYQLDFSKTDFIHKRKGNTRFPRLENKVSSQRRNKRQIFKISNFVNHLEARTLGWYKTFKNLLSFLEIESFHWGTISWRFCLNKKLSETNLIP